MITREQGVPSQSPRSPHDRALDCIRTLVDTLYHSARAVERCTGLTNAQLAVLRQVARHGPLTVNDVASRVRAGQSAVSIVAARLGRAKLIRRLASREDRRRVNLEVTTTGRRALRRSPTPPTEQLLAALTQLSPADAAMIADGLESLLRTMDRPTDRPPMLFE